MRREQTGETLVEILVSTTLLGIIGIGIIGSIASVLISTDIDRKNSQSETIIRSYAAAVQRAPYVPCGSTADYNTPPGFTDNPKYPASVTGVSYWNGVVPTVVPTVVPAPRQSSAVTFGACTPGSDHGLQQLQLQIDATVGGRPSGRGRAQLTLLKRDPAARPPASSRP